MSGLSVRSLGASARPPWQYLAALYGGADRNPMPRIDLFPRLSGSARRLAQRGAEVRWRLSNALRALRGREYDD